LVWNCFFLANELHDDDLLNLECSWLIGSYHIFIYFYTQVILSKMGEMHHKSNQRPKIIKDLSLEQYQRREKEDQGMSSEIIK